MKNKINPGSILLVAFIIISIIIGLFLENDSRLNRIKRKNLLTVITDNNVNCYYSYRNNPMGFEYELSKKFADYLGVDLKILTPGWENIFKYLEKNKGDLIAADLTITPERLKKYDFSIKLLPIQQYIIVHKNNYDIKSLQDLNGKKIHIREGTSFHEHLEQLIENGLDIELVLNTEEPTEELLRRIALGEIDITVSDSHIALLNRRYYPDIKMAFPITEKQWLGWAVNKGNSELIKKINTFLELEKNNGELDKLYKKYYANTEIFDYVDLMMFHRRVESILPKYETVIKEEAAKYGFDWRLIVAIIYQESHFDPEATSYTGVKGIMQVTKQTAEEVGIENRLDPKQSIAGGVFYLHKIYQRFDSIKGLDRMLFALASYNIGYGHVKDAMKIARHNGLDDKKWQSLRETLPLLRYRKYYINTKYGYARGTEPVRYINRILTYYDILHRKAILE